MFYLICAWINVCVNNREAGDFKHHGAHYDVTIMFFRLMTNRENWEKICNCWFEPAIVRRQIWGNAHLSCSFGLRWSHLALKWKTSYGKVRICWGAVTGTFHVNFSPLEAQKFNPCRLFCPKWGCNNLFFQECSSCIGSSLFLLMLGYQQKQW